MNEPAVTPPARRNSSGLRRDLELLHLLGSAEAVANGGLGVNRVAELSQRDKGTVSRTLSTLADAGLVSRDPATQAYQLGYQLYALAARTQEARLVRVASTFLRRMVTATHETTHLCVLRGGSVLTLASELSEHAFRGLGWEGVHSAAWQTSSGRVLVSNWGVEDLRRWYDVFVDDAAPGAPLDLPTVPPLRTEGGAVLPPGTGRVTDFASLSREIQVIRKQGYATVDEEFEAGVVGVSAPVFDFRQNIIAAINVSAPKQRLGTHLHEAGALAARVAGDLSVQLGALPR